MAPIRSGASVKSWATIFGKYNADGLDVDDTKNAPIFWSVAFAGSDNVIDEALTAGRKYIVTIELKGNDGNGAGGEDDPTTETVSEFMTINIDAAEWAVKHYTKTIN